MNRDEVMGRISNVGVVAVVRADSSEDLLTLIDALVAGGVDACEVTMTVPGALDGIKAAAQHFGDRALVGVGSVLDAETARMAILSGAQFVFSPIFNEEIIVMGHRYGRPVVPGAFTPTEIMGAWSAGADAIKVFPANHLGPTYFSDLLAPMPQLRLTPTGGVDVTTTPEWIRAGAFAVGAGSALVDKKAIRERNWADITSRAEAFVDAVKRGRQDISGEK